MSLLIIILSIHNLVIYKFDKSIYKNYKINVDVICQKARAFDKKSIFYKKHIHLRKNNFLVCKTNKDNEIATLEYIYSAKINEKVDFDKIKSIIIENFKDQIKHSSTSKENLINIIDIWYQSDFRNTQIQKKILNIIHSNFANSHLKTIKNVDEVIININFSKIGEIEGANTKATIMITMYFLIISVFIIYLILFFFYYGRSLHQK